MKLGGGGCELGKVNRANQENCDNLTNRVMTELPGLYGRRIGQIG